MIIMMIIITIITKVKGQNHAALARRPPPAEHRRVGRVICCTPQFPSQESGASGFRP